MITELSILIPTYNSTCVELVNQLHRMCEQIAKPFCYEILVADDGSTLPQAIEANQRIALLSHCQLLMKGTNTGSAATRNYLAAHSRYPWLLFLDSDMVIPDSDFIRRYLSCSTADVVSGGIRIATPPDARSNLRYCYEKAAEPAHTAARRNRSGFQQFRSVNFLIRRTCFEQHPFDERFQKSGYEDVLFGKQLCEGGATILHIDNPLTLVDFEDNQAYLSKCERSLRTLQQFRHELKGYSRLLDIAAALSPILKLWHRCFGSLERRHLTGLHPNLLVFRLYQLGYLASL